MSPLTPVLFTIPISIRDQLKIEPGYTEVAYDLIDSSLKQPSCTIVLNPNKPLFGKKPVTYKVSSKGQIRVPEEILDHLGLLHKDELDIEFWDDRLQLIRGRFYQLRDLIQEHRPSFFMSQAPEDDLITVIPHDEPDQGGRMLRVKDETFSTIKMLYHRIKAKYEPNNPNPWVGVPLDPEGSFEESGLSLTLDQISRPAGLTIQKLGPAFLPEPVAKLWRNRSPFSIIDETIFYFENGERVSEKINFYNREVSAIFYRNGRSYGDYHSSGGYPIETIDLYNGDLVVFELKSPFTLHYWPKIKH